MQLQGVAAVVAGGASGLGRATARTLVRAGARVAVLDANPEALQSVRQELGVHALACDVTDALATEHALASARAANGVERVLVNCAGIAPASRIARRDGPMPLADFAHVINVNLVGSFNLLRLSACAMQSLEPLERGEHGDGESGDGERGDGERGLVVLTASIAAYEGQIGQAAYAASKAGVIGLVLPAAREFARAGIRVCAIAPGVFETPMVAAMPADVQAALGQSIPFPQRLGRPDEFAALVEHIAGNVMINGTVLRLDGAHRMSAR